MAYEWDMRKARRTRHIRTAIVCLAAMVAIVPLSVLTLV